ncbi:MAG TPA: PLP-dependent aminotransferase family protein [Acidimicrobiales bacterium]|nr:PLP-dependent aminotransferase family protein [Acidimicrobiales bacterium]
MTTLVSALADWSSGPGALHERLSTRLRELVESGVLTAGSRLPSERAFARDLAVSRTTVVSAYESLRSMGLVASKQGSGTTVLPRLRQPPSEDRPTPGAPVFRPLLAKGQDAESLISFACAELPGLPAVTEAVLSLSRNDLSDLLCDTGYFPWGLPQLRSELADLVSSEGLPTEADQILVTTGAHQAIGLCASLFVHPGDLVLVENPTYPGCADAFASAGGRLVALPTDEEGMVLDGLERLLSTSGVAAAFVIPTFQNPTGALMAEHRRRRFADIAGRLSVPVIEDHALSRLRFTDQGVPPPIAAFAGADSAPVITVGSLSKAIWGGLRVGWIRAPHPWIDRLARRKVASDLGSGLLDQVVAARLVGRLSELQRHTSALLSQRLTHTETLLRRHLPDWRWHRPAGGPALWVQLPFDAVPFCQLAMRHGVELVPGSLFSTDGSFQDHVRIPFTADPTVMTEAVRRLAAASDAMPDETVRADRPHPAELVV